MQDIRYALRSLWHDRAFTITAILILALGIGSNTAIFSVVNTLLLQPPNLKAADRLVLISNTDKRGHCGLSSRTSRVANYLDWKRGTRTMEDMAAWFAFFDYGTYSMVGIGEPERLVGVDVTQNFLSFLGIQPEVGRWFAPEEAQGKGSARAVILTYGLWRRRFGGDRKVVERAVTLNNESYRVVGVLPESFDFSAIFTPGSRVDILVPFPLNQDSDRMGNTLSILGRLKPGYTVRQAQAELDVLSEQIRREHPDRYRFGSNAVPLGDYLTGRFRQGLLVLLGAVGLVLLIGCANLSSLMLSRATSRKKEMAIRSALGAGRARLVRQMLVESLMIVLPGALAGLGLALVAIRALGTIQGVNIPLLRTVRIDGWALGFTVLATVATAFLFGLLPALGVSGWQDAHALKEGGRSMSEGRRSGWTRNGLVLSEVALACMLLVGAGLLMRSFLRVLDVNPGFVADHAASWRIDTAGKFRDDVARLQYFDRLVGTVAAVPGVRSIGITDALPLSRDRSWGGGLSGVQYPPGEYPNSHPRLVDPGYLRTMGIPLLAGRQFDDRDTAGSPLVVIINQKMARRLFGSKDPLGGLVSQGKDGARIVGVVGDVRHEALETEGGLEMYFPIAQMTPNSVELVVRSSLPVGTVAASVGQALRQVDSTLPVAEYQELGALLSRAVSPRRFIVMLLGGFAVAALLLASVGIYGVVSYSVGRRTQEIGLRMALGATPFAVRREVMSRTMVVVGGGIVSGILGSLMVGRIMATLLFGLSPSDPVALGGTVALLVAVAVAAAYLPARRASKLDPMLALRAD